LAASGKTMKAPITRLLQTPRLTRARIVLALAVAVVTDALQFGLGPFGWAFVDQGLDVVAMVLTTWLLGFHLLLLPTFVVKLIPVADELPTWTACVIAVIALRRRDQPPELPGSHRPKEGVDGP
jgi:hypothetical protein